MSQFILSWGLSRKRFIEEVGPLSAEQLNWRPHANCLSIGEMALHVAGVETWFISQLEGIELDPARARLASTATEGVVNDNPFPYDRWEITPEVVKDALFYSWDLVEPVMLNPPPELLAKEIKSALGPIITGDCALARLAFHAAYHQGQAYLIKTSPGFPPR